VGRPLSKLATFGRWRSQPISTAASPVKHRRQQTHAPALGLGRSSIRCPDHSGRWRSQLISTVERWRSQPISTALAVVADEYR
jgi:hypothetical protein